MDGNKDLTLDLQDMTREYLNDKVEFYVNLVFKYSDNRFDIEFNLKNTFFENKITCVIICKISK